MVPDKLFNWEMLKYLLNILLMDQFCHSQSRCQLQIRPHECLYLSNIIMRFSWPSLLYCKSNKGAFTGKGSARHNTLAQIIILLQRKREAAEMRQTGAGWRKGDDKRVGGSDMKSRGSQS